MLVELSSSFSCFVGVAMSLEKTSESKSRVKGMNFALIQDAVIIDSFKYVTNKSPNKLQKGLIEIHQNIVKKNRLRKIDFAWFGVVLRPKNAAEDEISKEKHVFDHFQADHTSPDWSESMNVFGFFHA